MQINEYVRDFNDLRDVIDVIEKKFKEIESYESEEVNELNDEISKLNNKITNLEYDNEHAEGSLDKKESQIYKLQDVVKLLKNALINQIDLSSQEWGEVEEVLNF